MARRPLQETPFFPTQIQDLRKHLIDLNRQLVALFAEYGQAINDDLITRSDWTKLIAFADSPYAMLDSDRFLLVDTSAGNVVVNLPLAVDAEPHLFGIKKSDVNNTVTVNATGGDLIDGVASKTLNQKWAILVLIPDRSATILGWFLLHDGAP